MSEHGEYRPAASTAEVIDVISVQSQVIYGCVGNSIAVPSLTRNGLRALAVPTVLLSNTPHYPTCYGGEIPQQWFQGYLQAIAERGLDAQVRAIITGYLRTIDKAEALAAWLAEMRAKKPHLLMIIDPVLGDEDTGFYVDPALAQHYRDSLAPLATGLTPNRFELGCLCGETLRHEDEIVDAARSLLSQHTKWVVVTSAARSDDAQQMKVFCVTAQAVSVTEHPCYPDPPKGTGDLFTAEMTAGLLKGLPVAEAARQAGLFAQQCVWQTREAGWRELKLMA